MPTEKKLTKEDTWKSAELTKHVRDAGHADAHSRRREERERRARDNKDEERERRARDKNKEEERESRRARDNKDEERESRRARDNQDEERESRRARDPRDDRHVERKREREKERRRERDADTRGPDGDPQRRREGERERHKDRAREREIGDEKEKRREEREGERRREGGRGREGEHVREERERQKEREHRKAGDRRHDERPDKEGGVRPAEEKEEEKNKEHKRDRDRRKTREEGERGKEEERRREKEDGGGRDEERERRHRERRQKQVEDVGEGVSTQRRGPEEAKTRHHGDRDTEGRERRRARRHPVLPEAEPPGPDVPPAASERKAAAEPESTHAEPAYEDDFEEYEEDFEELDESGGEEEEEKEEVVESPGQEIGVERRKEVEAIQRAMEEENRRAGTAQSSRRRSRAEEESRPREPERAHQASPHRGSTRGPQRGNFIDFVAAKQREINQKVASKQKKRSTDLLRLVELDFSPTFSLLDLPPLSQYDVYIKSFGNSNTKQAYVQCREDDGDRDVQTDLIQVLDKWSQHPADHTGACGDPGRSQDVPDGNTAQINIDSQRLATFLHSAVQVMSVLLEEDHAERQSLRTTRTQTDALSFSEGNLQLNTQLPFLYGRLCSLLLFSSSQRQTLLSVHGPLDRSGAVRLDGWTLLCVWNMWEPSRPQKILVYESEVRCCCFSPGSSALVLAGTSDGSLLLWDLREPAGTHYSMTIAGTEWTFRQPTFSTDAVLSTLGHHSAVNAIEVLPSSSSSSSMSSTAADPQPPLLASEGMSFQLASLDERGILNLWVVLELTTASLAGSQTDLGLRPGGKVKLLHSSCMPAVEREGADIEALQLHFLPSDANRFLITTNMGVVHHGTAHGFRSALRDYRSQEGGRRPLSITSVHFSPFNPQLFLVGCSDGSMRLHIVSSHWPLAEWTTCRGGGASEVGVVSVRWSQSRPAVFCVLDSASHLHLWDLSRDPLRPVATETLHADGVTAMAVFGSSPSSSHQSSYSGVALAHRSGKLQLHYFNPSFSSANHTEEEDILQSMMHQAL